MEAQKFLKKYEQDQCEYCHKPYKTLKENENIFAYIDPDEGVVVEIKDIVVEFTKKILFCFMCGRELNKEV